MRIAVFGAGGVGGYFGARLAQAGEEVVFIARGEQLRAIREGGLRVESPLGDFAVRPAATDDPSDVGAVGAVIVGVKTWQVPPAARAMCPLIGPGTVVLPLQNGVEAAAQLAAELGRQHLLGGLCRIIAFVAAPGVIRHGGIEPYVALGELDNRRTERAERLCDAFRRAGVQAEIPPDIHVALWEKFLFIASLAGLGAVTRAPAGEIRSLPETRSMLEKAMNEIAAVAAAGGIRLPADTVEKTMAAVDGLPPAGTASMQRDIMEGRPSELEAHNGAVVRLGGAAGVPTPVNKFIYAALLPQERRARGEM